MPVVLLLWLSWLQSSSLIEMGCLGVVSLKWVAWKGHGLVVCKSTIAPQRFAQSGVGECRRVSESVGECRRVAESVGECRRVSESVGV